VGGLGATLYAAVAHPVARLRREATDEVVRKTPGVQRPSIPCCRSKAQRIAVTKSLVGPGDTPGVTCVFEWMRSPAYADDSLAVMGWEPLKGVKQIFESLAQRKSLLS